MLNNLVYIFIFLPVISGLGIFLLARNATVAKSLFLATICLMMLITFMITAECYYVTGISSDLAFDNTSILTEFSVNFALCVLTMAMILVKLVQVVILQAEAVSSMTVNRVRVYFASQLFSLLLIFGIIFSGNIFNIFLFIELYFINYYATSIIYKEFNDNDLDSRQIIIGCLASMVFLILIFAIYNHFETLNLSKIALKASSSTDSSNFIAVISPLFILSLLLKFIPFRLLLLKNYYSAQGELFSFLFISLNISLAIILKTYPIIFGNDIVVCVLVVICIMIIIYSSVMIMVNKHDSPRAVFFCIAIFCLSILCLSLKNHSSTKAMFLYIISYNVIAFAIFLHSNSHSLCSGINNCIHKAGLLRKVSYFSFILLLVCAMPLPHSILFYSNLYLIDAIIDNNKMQLYEFSNFFDPYILISIVFFYISMLFLFYRTIGDLVFGVCGLGRNLPIDGQGSVPCLGVVNLMLFATISFATINSKSVAKLSEAFTRDIFNIF